MPAPKAGGVVVAGEAAGALGEADTQVKEVEAEGARAKGKLSRAAATRVATMGATIAAAARAAAARVKRLMRACWRAHTKSKISRTCGCAMAGEST